MGETYLIQESRLVKLKKQYYKEYRLRQVLSFIVWILKVGVAVVGTGTITWYVYKNCVVQVPQTTGTSTISLVSCITTGSLFATFGSAILAVFTLYSSRNLTCFRENLSILTDKLTDKSTCGGNFLRWPFIPRVSRSRFDGEVHFFGIESADIEFQAGKFVSRFPLPTTETDFKDLPILLSYLRMKILRGRYLAELKTPESLSEYPVWDCVMAIYRSILCYKASWLCVWIGVCFVMQSIIFTFLYPLLWQIL